MAHDIQPPSWRIRASSLPTYLDCQVRWAAQTQRRMVLEAGFTLREIGRPVGGIVGAGLHAGITVALRPLLSGLAVDSLARARDAAAAAVSQEFAEGRPVVMDQTTGSPGEARDQTVSMVGSLYERAVPAMRPVLLDPDTQIEARLHKDAFVSGKPDMIELGEQITDLKSGSNRKAAGAQYGAYALLRKSHGLPTKRIVEVFQRRTKRTLDAPVITEIDVGAAERLASATLREAMMKLMAFSTTSDPLTFLPNPGSILCSSRYCPAWGTDFCHAHRTDTKEG